MQLAGGEETGEQKGTEKGQELRRVLVVWREEMTWKQGLEGVTENQYTIKGIGEDKDIHVRKA